jgi:hypothetical protein
MKHVTVLYSKCSRLYQTKAAIAWKHTLSTKHTQKSSCVITPQRSVNSLLNKIQKQGTATEGSL